MTTKVNEAALERAVRLCREKRVVLPTLAQMREPAKVPAKVKEALKRLG